MVEDVIKTIKENSKNIDWRFLADGRQLTVGAVFMDTYSYSMDFAIPEYTLNEWDHAIAFHIIDKFLEKFNDDHFRVIW